MKKLFYIILALAAFFYVVYLNVGGFERAKVVQTTTMQKYIVGKKFEGNTKDEVFSTLFIEIEELKKSENYNGHLGGVYYNNPSKNEGKIKAFLGVILEKKIENIPNGFEIRVINSSEVLEGKILASNYFGISINKVYEAIFDFAEANNIILEDYFVEWFPSEDEVIVQIKIKK